MKRITSYETIEDDRVHLANGTQWELRDPCRQIEVTFWAFGDPVETEDYGIGSYLNNLNGRGRIPAVLVVDPARDSAA